MLTTVSSHFPALNFLTIRKEMYILLGYSRSTQEFKLEDHKFKDSLDYISQDPV